MLKLNLQKEPYWLDLTSKVRVRVKPLTNALMSAAQNSVIREANRLHEANNLPKDESIKLGLSESLLIKALARNAILEWEGVLTADGTKTAQVTSENINELMDIWFIAQDFWKKYMQPLGLLEQEGKSSELSPSGTLVVAQNIAEVAVNKNYRAAKGKKTKQQANSAHM